MATKALTKEEIAMTEKKMNMSLDDIIKMSKKNAAKGKRPPRPPIKNQGFQNRNPSHGNNVLQGFMDSRSSIRQGVLAKRRSNFHGNQFLVITEVARKAAAISAQNRMINENGRRVLTPTLQRSANAGSSSKRPQTLDALFANMNEMRMNFVSQKINPRGSVQLERRSFGSRQQQRRGGPRGDVQLVQEALWLKAAAAAAAARKWWPWPSRWCSAGTKALRLGAAARKRCPSWWCSSWASCRRSPSVR